MSLASRTLTMIHQQVRGPQTGTVISADSTTGRASVRIAGEPVEGLAWLGSTPVRGSTVVVVAGVIQGVISIAPTPIPESIMIEVQPVEFVQVRRSRTANYWAPPVAWTPERDLNIKQGGHAYSDGQFVHFAGLVRYDIARIVPDGSVDVLMRLRLSRSTTADAPDYSDPASPVLHGITYEPLPDNSDDGENGPAPEFHSGYRDWRPGRMARDEIATFDIPDAWVRALSEGTITGLAFASDAIQDGAEFRNILTQDLAASERQGEPVYRRKPPPWQNAHIFITYTPPITTNQ